MLRDFLKFVLFRSFPCVSIDLVSDPYTSPQEQLDAAISNMHAASRNVTTYEARAEDMRRVARNLEGEVAKLNNVFLPIRLLHTANTWQGNAATLSRQRLDGHEDRFHSAIQMINGTISDLAGAAAINDGRARSAKSTRDYYRRQANAIEIEMGQYDNVYS